MLLARSYGRAAKRQSSIISRMKKTIEQRLTGGHPNSLGETVSVASDVLLDESQKLMDELCNTYASQDEVVRLRVSSALKRVCGLHRDSLPKDVLPKPMWILSRFDWLIGDIGWNLDQPSAKWSIAQMVQQLQSDLDESQKARAIKLLKHNLETEKDWIVQNMTGTTLADFAIKDKKLREWLLSKLQDMKKDKRKSVSGKAEKIAAKLKEVQ